MRLSKEALAANSTPMHGHGHGHGPGGLAWPGAPGPAASGDPVTAAGDKAPSGGVGGGGGGGASGGSGVAGLGGDKYVYEMVAMVKNVDFLMLRTRCDKELEHEQLHRPKGSAGEGMGEVFCWYHLVESCTCSSSGVSRPPPCCCIRLEMIPGLVRADRCWRWEAGCGGHSLYGRLVT